MPEARKVVQALSHMFVGEVVCTFQFDDEYVVHEDVGEVIPHALALIIHRERGL
jgi:hypothetical protein